MVCGVVGVGQQAHGVTHNTHPEALQPCSLPLQALRSVDAAWGSRGEGEVTCMKPSWGCVALGGTGMGPAAMGAGGWVLPELF